MSYSSTRIVTFMLVKSTSCTICAPERTSSPSSTSTSFTVPANSAFIVSPPDSRASLSPFSTRSPSCTYSVRMAPSPEAVM